MTSAELRTGALESLRIQVSECVQCRGIHTLRPDRDILSRDTMCDDHVEAINTIDIEFPDTDCTQTVRSVYGSKGRR